MAIELTKSREQYVAGAGQVTYSIPFAFELATDIEVYAGAFLVAANAYTVVGAGINPTPATRTFTFDSAYSAGTVITVRRQMPYNRSTDFTVGGNFSAININNEVDRMVLMMQQLETHFTALSLQYPPYVDDSGGESINQITKLPANTGAGIPVITTNTDADVIIGTVTEDTGCSTLRSELFNGNSGTDGARIVKYYNNAGATSTVRDTLSTLESATISGFLTGMKVEMFTDTAPTGWVALDDGTIGNATSGASNRANADTETLFALIWDKGINSYLPVYDSVGAATARGASAAADYAANKAIALPRCGNMVSANYRAQSFSCAFSVDVATNKLTLTLVGAANAAIAFPWGAPVTLTSTGSLPAPLAISTTYYVIGVSATTIYLALASTDVTPDSTVPIDITDTGGVGAVHTMHRSMTVKDLGYWEGENTHLARVREMAAHTHGNQPSNPTPMAEKDPDGLVTKVSSTLTPTDSTGSSQAMNVTQPTSYWGWYIKL